MHKLVTLVNTNQIKPAIAPLAFDYLYEPLTCAGFNVDLLDLCFADDFHAAIAAYCRSKTTHFWGVTLRNTDDTYFASKSSFLDLISDIIQTIKHYSTVPIVMGGVGFSIMPEKILQKCGVQFGILCEGEISFPLLLTRLVSNEPYDDIPGLVYRTAQGFQRNPVAFADLKQVGTHRRELINNSHYFSTGGQAGIETKRGCNRVCIYCVEPLVKGRKVRLRDPTQIVDEIEALLAQGANVFHINDSEFNLDIQHALRFCDELLQRKLSHVIQWYAYGMPTPFPDLLAQKMCEAGCKGMNFGVDSASERMLRVLKRTFRPYHIERAVQTCRRYGMAHMLEILLGAPGETGETVAETIRFLKHINPERVSVTLGLRIFPNTELEQLVRAEGISPDNPNLHGAIEGNDDLLQPIFYLSSLIAPNPFQYVAELIGSDDRFFGVNTNDFNYNMNQLLVNAIAQGEKGAYWAILDKLAKRNIAHSSDSAHAPISFSSEQK